MKTLTIKELQFLQRLYSNNGPKYVPTVGLLDQFIDRFKNHPEWMDKVQFFTINESTLNYGTFLMVYYTVDGPCIAFNSLESRPDRNLECLLNTLNYSEKKFYKFWSVSEEFDILIKNLVEGHDLEILENSSCICHVFELNKEKLLKMIKNAPDGFYYDSLKESDVPKIKSTLTYIVLPGYLEAVIKYNPTTALYTHDGELIAWSIMHENGETGMLEVVKKYKRRGFGSEIVLRQSLKLQDKGRLFFRNIFHGNNVAQNFSEGVNHKFSGAVSAGNFSFVTLRPRVNDSLSKSKL